MPVIQMKAITDINPARLQMAKVRQAAQAELQKQGRRYRTLYEATTANWKGTKPTFTTEVEMAPDEWKVTVWTDDKIYRFLHDGTRERWAVMSDDWSSQTHPRILGSAPGAGVVVFRGKKVMGEAGYQAPLPGIKAREWTQEIVAQDGTKFKDAMEKAILGAIPSHEQMLSLH